MSLRIEFSAAGWLDRFSLARTELRIFNMPFRIQYVTLYATVCHSRESGRGLLSWPLFCVRALRFGRGWFLEFIFFFLSFMGCVATYERFNCVVASTNKRDDRNENGTKLAAIMGKHKYVSFKIE